MSSRLPAEMVTNSTHVSGPATCTNLVIRNESEKDEAAEVSHNCCNSQIDEKRSDLDNNSLYSISTVEAEENAARPLQHYCKKGNKWNHDEALEIKNCPPSLSTTARRQGRQDICIVGSGTYEFAENGLSPKYWSNIKEKRRFHRHGQGPLALNKSCLLYLKSLDQDTSLAQLKDKSSHLLTAQCPFDAIDERHYETSSSAGGEFESFHRDSSFNHGREIKYSHVLQESTSCIKKHSRVCSETAGEEFSWITIWYDGSGDKEDENAGGCGQSTTRA